MRLKSFEGIHLTKGRGTAAIGSSLLGAAQRPGQRRREHIRHSPYITSDARATGALEPSQGGQEFSTTRCKKDFVQKNLLMAYIHRIP